jgi:hypothetical protein
LTGISVDFFEAALDIGGKYCYYFARSLAECEKEVKEMWFFLQGWQ